MSEQEIEREELEAPEPEIEEPGQPRDEQGRFAPRDAEPEQDDPDLVATARKYGWRPKEDFTLKPESWRPAKDFLESPQTQVKILRDELRERDDRFSRIERTTAAALDAARQQERQRFDAELAAIRQQKQQAVEQADPESYKALDEREEALRKQAPVHQPAAPTRNEALDAYVASPEGAWVKDPELFRWATAAVSADPLVPAMPPIDQFRWAEHRLRQAMPWRFPAETPPPAQQQTHSRVDGGGLGGGRKSKTIKDLPKEAQEAFAMFQRQGIKMTEAQYITEYEKG